MATQQQTDGFERRSPLNALRVERDITRRQISHVLVCAGVYIFMTTAAMSAHYVWIHHAAGGTLPETGSLVGEITRLWLDADGFRRALLSWVIGMTALSAVFTIGVGAYFARNVAGPVHAMKRDLGRIIQSGRPGRVSLRAGDDLEELAETINSAMAAVEAATAGAADADAVDQLDALRRDVVTQLDRFEQLDLAGLEPRQSERMQAWLGGIRSLVDKTAGDEVGG